jgi:hypothetical protein
MPNKKKTADKIEAVKVAARVVSDIQKSERLTSRETEDIISEVTKRLLDNP